MLFGKKVSIQLVIYLSFAYIDMTKHKLDNSRSDCNSGSIWLGNGNKRFVRIWVFLLIQGFLTRKSRSVKNYVILPELKELWPKKGDKLYIRLEVDKKVCIWGVWLIRKTSNV